MKFQDFEIDEEEKDYGYMYGKRSQDGKYDIMVGVVMYGYRVYVRTANNRVVFLQDLCGGPNAKSVSTLYTLVESQLSRDKPMDELIREIPRLNIKPFTNDIDFILEFHKILSDDELITNNITQEGLQAGRDRLFAKYK